MKTNSLRGKTYKDVKYFYTGKPCKNGHISKRYLIGRGCVECKKLARPNKEKANEYSRAWNKKNADYVKYRDRRRLYGITKEQYDLLISNQNNKCAICNNELDGNKKTCVDHDKETGKIRGILCWTCNIGLGHFYHNSELLKKAALYCD